MKCERVEPGFDNRPDAARSRYSHQGAATFDVHDTMDSELTEESCRAAVVLHGVQLLIIANCHFCPLLDCYGESSASNAFLIPSASNVFMTGACITLASGPKPRMGPL